MRPVLEGLFEGLLVVAVMVLAMWAMCVATKDMPDLQRGAWRGALFGYMLATVLNRRKVD